MPRTVFAVTGKVNFCWFCSVSTPFRARHCMQGMGHVKNGIVCAVGQPYAERNAERRQRCRVVARCDVAKCSALCEWRQLFRCVIGAL